MGKTRVGVLFRESMGGNKSSNKSQDLAALTERYHGFCKRIRGLVVALKAHHEHMSKIEASRVKVAKSFGEFTKETPLYDCIGLMPSQDRPSNTVCSYASVHDNLAGKTQSYSAKYQEFVLSYAVEWEKVIRTRIDNGIKKAEELRIELDHYQKKVESLRLTANQAMAKGKPVPSSQQEKLTRNEEKLISSKQTYNRVATDVCILMEEVTERSWRDLHPLLVKVAQFDMTISNDEAKILSGLNQVVASLKQVATEKGLSAQPRLKDLAGLKPELLSTRPGGVAGLTIEASAGTYSMNEISTTSPTAMGELTMPPGSGGSQGMQGYPVQISPSNDFGRSNSVSSFHSAPLAITPAAQTFGNPGTLSMLALSNSAAPAPTLDDIYGVNPSSTRSAPASGNLPPLPPSSASQQSPWTVRSSSFNDADSAYSGFSAPMPSAAPPPPPNMPPHPPPMPPVNYGAPSSATMSPWSNQPTPTSSSNVNPLALYGAPAHAPSPPAHGYNPFG